MSLRVVEEVVKALLKVLKPLCTTGPRYSVTLTRAPPPGGAPPPVQVQVEEAPKALAQAPDQNAGSAGGTGASPVVPELVSPVVQQTLSPRAKLEFV
jgi:hypothetical protein